MNFSKKTFFLSLPILLLSFSSSAAPTASKKLVDKTVAIVNQDIILYSEFEAFKKTAEEDIRRGGDARQKEDLNNPQVFPKKILETMIEDRLMEQEVKTLGLEATDSQLESAIGEVMKNNGLRSRKDLDRALRTEGITYDELASGYKKRIGKSNLISQIIRPKIKISEDEIDTEYKKRTQAASKEFQYQVGMIFISKNNATAKEAERIRKSINSLSDFANVANEKTEGPGKGKGGDMGWIDATDLQAPLGDTIKKMKKGMVSALLTTDGGYYVLACLDLKSKASTEEIRIRSEIREDLMNTLLTKNIDQYILDLKRKAHIEKFL